MLLKHLYMMSLQFPGPGCAIYCNESDIGYLGSYVRGFIMGQEEESELFGRPRATRDDEEFWDWLYDRGEYPTQGWARHCLEKCGNDNDKALARFFGLLHTFLLERRPEWFVEFNATPQPSPIRNGLGQPWRLDIRLPQHVELVGSSRDR